MNANQILVWVQVGGKMAQVVATGIESVKAMIAASGQTDAEKNAALDRTLALYDEAIAHEQRLAAGGEGA